MRRWDHHLHSWKYTRPLLQHTLQQWIWSNWHSLLYCNARSAKCHDKWELATILLAHHPLSSLAYAVSTHGPPVASNFTIKTLHRTKNWISWYSIVDYSYSYSSSVLHFSWVILLPYFLITVQGAISCILFCTHLEVFFRTGVGKVREIV